MKKFLFVISSILFAAFFVVLVANANNNAKEPKKAKTEVTKKCCDNQPVSGCGMTAQAKDVPAGKCTSSKTQEMCCAKADCTKDPATCKAVCKELAGEVKKCPQAACAK